MWETWVRSLGREDLLEKGKETHSSILAWRIHFFFSFVFYLCFVLFWVLFFFYYFLFLPGESDRQRSLVGSNPQDHKESDITGWLHFLLSSSWGQHWSQSHMSKIRICTLSSHQLRATSWGFSEHLDVESCLSELLVGFEVVTWTADSAGLINVVSSVADTWCPLIPCKLKANNQSLDLFTRVHW